MTAAEAALNSLKPYPAYKDSGVEWIGEVPAQWAPLPLKQGLSQIIMGGTPNTDDSALWDDEGTPWVTIADMTRQSKLKTTNRSLSRLGLDSKRLRPLPVGTVLYSIYASLGKVAVLEVPAVTNQAILALIPTEDVIPDFLRYWLNGLEPHVIASANTNTQNNLNQSKVRNLPFVKPSEREQQAIAAFLDYETARIDELVREQEQLLEDLSEKRRATCINAVTRGLHATATQELVAVWLPALPAHWQSDALKRLVQIQGGMTPPDESRLWHGGVPWVTPKDMKRPVIDSTEDTVSELAVSEGRLKLFPSGCLLMVVRSGILRHAVPVAVNDVPVTVNQDMKVFQPATTIRAKFLYYFFEGLGPSLLPVIQKAGATVESVNMAALRNLQVPVPPLPEQDEIITYLDDRLAQIDQLTTEVRANIEDMKLLRSTLITAAVTGKIDVRHWCPA
ncbi:restriction endonuclease subunit S [Deinococcus aquaticus]|uniref:restriction endonuclease subunit S n=1 Tax=Deinococcus aquaticus TaxID=328692 RepID=UPI003F48688B